MAGGRPTKYNSKIPSRVLEYLANENDEWEVIPTLEGVALYLDVNTDTIHEWKKDPEKRQFSDSIKKVLETQSQLLQRGGLKQKFNPTMSIFLLKVNHGKVEKSAVDVTSGGKPIPAPMLGGNSVLPDNSDKKDSSTKQAD